MNLMIYSLWRKAPEDASILRQLTPSRSEILWPLIKETQCDGLEVSQGGISRCSDQGTITSNSIRSQIGSGTGAIYLLLLDMTVLASSVSSFAPSSWV